MPMIISQIIERDREIRGMSVLTTCAQVHVRHLVQPATFAALVTKVSWLNCYAAGIMVLLGIDLCP